MSHRKKRRAQRHHPIARPTRLQSISQFCLDGQHDGTGGRGRCPQFVTYEMQEFAPGLAAPANPVECECDCHAAFSRMLREEGQQMLALGCTPLARSLVMDSRGEFKA